MADNPSSARPPEPPMVRPVRSTLRRAPDGSTPTGSGGSNGSNGSNAQIPPSASPMPNANNSTPNRPLARSIPPASRPVRSSTPKAQPVTPPTPPVYNPAAVVNAKGIYAYTSSSMPGRPVPYTAPPYAPTVVAQGLYCHFARSNFTLQIQDLRIFPAEITYIGGESGSGKTTLMKMLTLETQPERGNIFMLNNPVAVLTPDQRDDFRGGGITYLPQGHLGLVDGITPVETIARLLYDYDGIDLAIGEARAEVALARARLPRERFRVRVKDLSGGERARVAIAKAYAAERPLCLADEILAALDEPNRIAVIDLFQDLAEDGFTVIVIAHQPEMKNRFHRAIEIEHGRIKNDMRYMPVVRGP